MNTSITVELIGPYEGRTVKLGAYQFTDGKCTVAGNFEQVQGAVAYLRTCYQAFPEGSTEGKQLREQLTKSGFYKKPVSEKKNGNDKVLQDSGSGNSEKVSGGAAQEPESPTGKEESRSNVDAPAKAGNEGVRPARSGSESTQKVK